MNPVGSSGTATSDDFSAKFGLDWAFTDPKVKSLKLYPAPQRDFVRGLVGTRLTPLATALIEATAVFSGALSPINGVRPDLRHLGGRHAVFGNFGGWNSVWRKELIGELQVLQGPFPSSCFRGSVSHLSQEAAWQAVTVSTRPPDG